jgi:phosphoglycolate phosphatase
MIAGEYCAVVFDLDGTLADTAIDIREALVRALAGEGLPPIDVASVRLMIGGGPRLLVERALHRLGVPAREDLVNRLAAAFHAEARRHGNRNSRLFDGAESALRQLHRSGVRIGLCSNKPDDLCRDLVRDLGIDEYIDEILGSSEQMPKKPDPALLLGVIERLGVPPGETLYVGDSATDVATARAAGVPVMLVSYGYTLRSATQLGADAVIDSIAELLRPGQLKKTA